MNQLDKDGQPSLAFRARENVLKAIEHLLGICRGIMIDGQLSDQEISLLATWLDSNAGNVDQHPVGRLVHERVASVLDDGVITDEERAELVEVLSSVIGGGLQKDSGAGGLSIDTPSVCSANTAIVFPEKLFVVTGKFIFGPRRKVEEAIAKRGGSLAESINRSVNYLVVGTMGSRDWSNTSFGTKIERAMRLREDGYSISIVDEAAWTDALKI